MADFVAVLKKTLDGLGETTPEMRARVYDKARSTIAAKLAALNPAPPPAMAERQQRALEDAIATVERGYARSAASDPLAELEDIFSSIDRNRTQPNHTRPATKAEPARHEPVKPEPPKPAPAWQNQAREPRQPEAKPAPFHETPAAAFEPGAVPAAVGPAEPETDAVLPGHDESPEDRFREERRTGRRGYGRPIAAVVALLVVAGAAYGLWVNRTGMKASPGTATKQTAAVKPAEQPAATKPAEPAPAANAPAPGPAAATGSADAGGEPAKFTQRLLPDGKEVDPGPSGGEAGVGEGTSIVALTTQPPPVAASTPNAAAAAAAAGQPAASGEAAPGPASGQQAVPVGQKAIFYEERTSTSEGSAESGNIVWSLVQESPGGDAPPEPAIRAEATIPGKDVQLRMTIRRNADQTLPASHIIEMIFLTPDGFEGGSIDNVLRVAMKASEQEAGSPLIGIPAKIADGFFLVALNDTKADEDANLTLLRKQDWIDIPIVYKSGRRALLTMEKGIPGEKVFDEALKAWQAKTAG